MTTQTPPKDAVYYERLYQNHHDPWDYLHAAEQAKYRLSLDAARRWQPRPGRVLETACSLGYLTDQLADYAPDVYAYDVSETAVAHARQRCQRLGDSATRFHFRVGDAGHPAYPDAFFNVIFLQDVLLEVTSDVALRRRMLDEALRMLAPGGVLVMTDYQQPADQDDYVRLVEEQAGRVVEKLFFHDRYWFRLRGALKALWSWKAAQTVLRSEVVYRTLARLGAWRGPEGSKHFGLVVQRNS